MQINQAPSSFQILTENMDDDVDELFIGSMMFKVHLKSNGGEPRYFHFDRE